jgi:hypothetical protein
VSATAQPTPQRERSEARECQRGTQQPPRRERRCGCCGTRAYSHPVGQVAARMRQALGHFDSSSPGEYDAITGPAKCALTHLLSAP